MEVIMIKNNSLFKKIALISCVALYNVTPVFSYNSIDAQTDLLFIFNTIVENHPGIYNQEDPDFYQNMIYAFEKSFKELQNNSTDDAINNQTALLNFMKSFNDIHARVIFNNSFDNTKKPPVCHQPFLFEPTDYGVYIKIPTFSPESSEKILDMNNIINHMDVARQSSSIVFDLTGNGGGNSAWGKAIVDNLFGPGYTYHQRHNILKNQYTEWRTSTDNINHLFNVKEKFMSQQLPQQEVIDWIDSLINGMINAHTIDQKLYSTASNTYMADQTNLHEKSDSLYKNTIIILIDDHCASSTLSFIDDLYIMTDKIVLIGKQTKADSLYMECRFVELPSQEGIFCFPIKVYRNRARGNNVPYTPDIIYNDDIQNTQKVQTFVANMILHNQAL